MKKGSKWLIVLAVMMVITVSVTIVIQSSDNGPEAVLEKFVSAYNAVDVDKMLDCFEPSIARPIKSMMGIAGSLLGVNVNDIFGMMPFVADLMPESYGLSGTMPKISCEVNQTVIDGSTATVYAMFSIREDGETINEAVELDFVKIDGTWYITE